MKKITITAFFAVAAVVETHAQDVIVTTKTEKIEAKVTEIDVDVVRYKQYDFQDGPTFVIKKSDIDSIVYQNGQVVVFEQQKEDYHYFKSLSDKQMSAFLKENDAENHEIFLQGEMLKKRGKSLLIPGIAITGVGGLTIILGGAIIPLFLFVNPILLYWWMEDIVPVLLKVGFSIVAIGQPFLIASIVLRTKGGSLKKQAKNNYENKFFKSNTETSLIFNFYPNGFGINLKF